MARSENESRAMGRTGTLSKTIFCFGQVKYQDQNGDKLFSNLLGGQGLLFEVLARDL